MRAIFSNVIRKNLDLVWISIVSFLFAGVPSLVSTIFNANYWYDIRSVKIESGPDFNKLVAIVDRSIYKDFTGDFDVAIWPIDLSGPICRGSGKGIPYKSTKTEILSRTVEWLIGDQSPPKCMDTLKVNEKYIANVTVTIHPPESFLWWMPLPKDSVWSTVFMIKESSDG